MRFSPNKDFSFRSLPSFLHLHVFDYWLQISSDLRFTVTLSKSVYLFHKNSPSKNEYTIFKRSDRVTTSGCCGGMSEVLLDCEVHLLRLEGFPAAEIRTERWENDLTVEITVVCSTCS